MKHSVWCAAVATLGLLWVDHAKTTEADAPNGFAEFQLGMTYEALIHSGTEIVVYDCKVFDEPNFEKCVKRSANVYGFPARVFALFKKGDPNLRLVRLIIDIPRNKSRSCNDRIDVVWKILSDRYGTPDEAKDEMMLGYKVGIKYNWHFKNGVSLRFKPLCVTSNHGFVNIIYEKGDTL